MQMRQFLAGDVAGEGAGVEIWIGDQHISLPVHVILALICLFFLARYQRQVVDDYRKWDATKAIIPPSLASSPPPLITVYRGVSGCLWSMGGGLVMAVLGLILLDLLFAKGAFLADVLRVLFGG